MTTDKTPATLAVDVLAVMDREAKLARHCRIENGAVKVAEEASADATAARSAVAELIEALEGLEQAYCRAGSPLDRAERMEDRKRLIAASVALARVKGESA